MPAVPDSADPTSAATIRARVERALGQAATEWEVPETGLSAAARYSVTLADRSRVFVKAATDDDTERWLRTEHLALQRVPGRFVPAVVAWLDGPDGRPILVVEDLSRAHWPASHRGVCWRGGDLVRVIAAVADLSLVRAPTAFEARAHGPAHWPALASDGSDRAAFLDLGLCSPAWLSVAAPLLVQAEATLDDTGDRVVHGDLRSDNICLDGTRVVFVDWSHAARGHPDHDLAQLLPTLHLEGGPRPVDVMPNGGEWAAAGSASLARRLLDETALPGWLAEVFIRLIAIDLEWAAASLGIPAPDGADWRAI